jgi:quercetin dioxygenase-like cupin family protein
MNVIDVESLPANAANPNYFSGDVTLRPISTAGTDPVKLIRVEFGPAARTHWHTHSGVQILFIAAGRCRFQRAGGSVGVAEDGATI